VLELRNAFNVALEPDDYGVGVVLVEVDVLVVEVDVLVVEVDVLVVEVDVLVVEVDVLVWPGDVCACAGTTMASTTGLIQRSGKSAAPTMPPSIASLSTRRRSGVRSLFFLSPLLISHDPVSKSARLARVILQSRGAG
jgi:hypothetical protein